MKRDYQGFPTSVLTLHLETSIYVQIFTASPKIKVLSKRSIDSKRNIVNSFSRTSAKKTYQIVDDRLCEVCNTRPEKLSPQSESDSPNLDCSIVRYQILDEKNVHAVRLNTSTA